MAKIRLPYFRCKTVSQINYTVLVETLNTAQWINYRIFASKISCRQYVRRSCHSNGDRKFFHAKNTKSDFLSFSVFN